MKGRLAEPPIQGIRDLIYGPGIDGADDAAFADMCQLNKAQLVMLAETGILSSKVAISLASALKTMQIQGRGVLPTDRDLEDPYLVFEARLGVVAGEDHAGRLHTGRSRNDLGATLDHLHARRLCLQIMAAIERLRSVLLTKAAQHLETIVPGYTHLQPAQPITFGFYLASVAAAFERDWARLSDCYRRINVNCLGAAALGGTSFPIDRDLTARLMGFDAVAVPGLDAVASRDFTTELGFAATTAAITWSRVVQDFYVLVTDEFSSIGFPDRIAGTSSIMPQKKNPIALEYLRTEASRAIGALVSALSAFKGSNFSISLDAIREGQNDIWAVLDRVPGDLDLFGCVVAEVQVAAARLEARCHRNFSTATDLADGLVRQCDLPFREAHHVVGAIVHDAVEAGMTAEDIDATMVNRIAEPIVGRPLGLSDDFVRSCLDPRQAVAARTTTGGTAPSEVARILAEQQKLLSIDAAFRAGCEARLAEAAQELDARLDRLAAQADA